MAGFASDFMYHLVVNNIAPIMASSLTGMYTSYFSGRSAPTPILLGNHTDDERELDLLQMDRMLKWMHLVFEDRFIAIETVTDPGSHETSHEETPQDEMHKAYKKELYSIYINICSDYSQYRKWKQYNSGIWVFSSYRKKNTKDLARKILADIKLFHEGLKMFSMFDKL
jgi:hypothetical protein